MRTQKLLQIQILGKKEHQKQVVKQLQAAGVMHIEKATPSKELEKQVSLEGVEEVAEKLIKLRFIADRIGKLTPLAVSSLPELEETLAATDTFLKDHLEQVKKKAHQAELLDEQILEKQSELSLLEKLPLVPAGKYMLSISSSPIKGRRKKVKGKYYVLKKGGKGKPIHLKKPLKEIKKKMRKDIANLQAQFKVKKRILQLALGKDHALLSKLIAHLENFYSQLTITNEFLGTKNFFYLIGYVSPLDFDRIKLAVPQVVITTTPAKDAPSKLKNLPITSKFQVLTRLFDMPAYGSLDPTPFVAFFYPLFFGFMFSDVGYGIMLLIAILAFKKQLKDGFSILLTSAISTIIFGFVFGSFFGSLIPIPSLFGDAFSISKELLIASLVIGLVHINLGVILNIMQEKRKLKNILALIGIPILEVSLLAFALSHTYLGITLLVIAIFAFLKDKSWMGVLDITAFFGNWFSYARLLALSLATAGIALAVNVLAEKIMSAGGFFIILGIILLIGGHLFNFVVNLIGTAINAARLQYVEFFSLFFRGGGTPFTPFELKNFGGKQWM